MKSGMSDCVRIGDIDVMALDSLCLVAWDDNGDSLLAQRLCSSCKEEKISSIEPNGQLLFAFDEITKNVLVKSIDGKTTGVYL